MHRIPPFEIHNHGILIHEALPARKARAGNYYPNTVLLLGVCGCSFFLFSTALAFWIDESSFRNEEIGPVTADAR